MSLNEIIDLSHVWGYIKYIAKERLHNNITARHVYKHGPEIEVVGAAGELAARISLGLPQKLHTQFDGGKDLVFGDQSIDVKSTRLTPHIQARHLQWPLGNPINCDVAILVGVDMQSRSAKVLGFATAQEILEAPINHTRYLPCQEIAISQLHPIEELYANYRRNPKPTIQLPADRKGHGVPQRRTHLRS